MAGRTKYQRVHVEYFCTLCGKTEFEGAVFGRDVVRHLHAQPSTREMICDHCKEPPPIPSWVAKILAFSSQSVDSLPKGS